MDSSAYWVPSFIKVPGLPIIEGLDQTDYFIVSFNRQSDEGWEGPRTCNNGQVFVSNHHLLQIGKKKTFIDAWEGRIWSKVD